MFDSKLILRGRYERPLTVAVATVESAARTDLDAIECPASGLLTAVARAWSEHIRQTDLVVRLDRRTLAILMPRTTLEGAAGLCERLCREARESVWCEGLAVRVRLVESRPAESVTAALARAEAAPDRELCVLDTREASDPPAEEEAVEAW